MNYRNNKKDYENRVKIDNDIRERYKAKVLECEKSIQILKDKETRGEATEQDKKDLEELSGQLKGFEEIAYGRD